MPDDQAGQIEVLNPQGQTGNIPLEQMDDALSQGYKLSKHILMYDPQGRRGLVPKEQGAEAMKAGYQTTPETNFEKQRKEPTLRPGQQEEDYRRAYGNEAKRGGLVLTDADVAQAGLGLMGAGKSLARQGIKETAKGLARVGIGGVTGSAAGGYVGRKVGGTTGERIGGALGGLAGGYAAGKYGIVPSRQGLTSLWEGLRPAEPPVYPGASLPSADEFYARRGAEMNAMRRMQPQGTPFEELTPINPGATQPSADEFYERRGADLMRRGIQEDRLARTAATTEPKGIVSTGLPGPRVSGSEGRPATWTNERVLQLARQGNRDAIAQAVRRGMELPENTRYVMGDAAYPRAVYNPKEVTIFTPEGTPIRNVADPRVTAPRARVALPEGVNPEPGEPPAVKPPRRSEKVELMSEKPKDLGAEFNEGEVQHEISRNKDILRNERATPEEKAIARDRLRDAEESAAKPKAQGRNVKPNAGIEKRLGVKLRGEWPEGHYDFQDLQTGGTVTMKKEGFSEDALNTKLSEHRQAIRNTPPEGRSDVATAKQEAAEARHGEGPAKTVHEEYSPEQLEDAELGIRQELEMRQAGDRPGHYYIENELGEFNPQREQSAAKEVTSGGHWIGIRGMKNLKYTQGFSPSEIEVALKRGNGRVYDTLVRRAVRSPEEIEKATEFKPEGLGGISKTPRIAKPSD